MYLVWIHEHHVPAWLNCIQRQSVCLTGASEHGASEHAEMSAGSSADRFSASEWHAALASYHVGLAASAVRGSNWKQHRAKLQGICTELLSSEAPVVALLLCEVGNLDDLCDEECQARVEDAICESFQAAGATEHGPPKFYWAGETVSFSVGI